MKDINFTGMAVAMQKYILFVGLQNYCRFGMWSDEENKQLRKNWKNATKVTHF